MAESTVIKEFLVALGFSVDSSKLSKFEEGITKASKAVVGLATAVTGTALAVAVGVQKFASNLEELYFASQRTGTSVASLKAFSIAIQDFGGSAEGALASVDAMARYFRDNPSAEGIVNSFLFGTGRTVADAKGDMAVLETFLGEAFRRNAASGQQYRNAQIAGQLGIDERTMLALQNGNFEDTPDKFRRANSGIDWQKAARDAHTFEERLRNLKLLFEVFVGRVGEGLLKAFGTSIDKITRWLQNPGNSDKITAVLKDIVDWAGKIVGWVGKVIDKFTEWDAATDGWSTKLIAFSVVLKLLGGAEIISGILALSGAIGSLGVSLAGLGAVAAGTWLGTWIDKHSKLIVAMGESIGGAMADLRDFAPDRIHELTSYGFTQAQAAGIVANLQAESGLNPHAIGDGGTSFGLAQWHDPKHLADFQKQYGHPIWQATPTEQMEFLARDTKANPQLMALINANRNSAGASAEIFSRMYERPAGGAAEAIRRSNAAEQLYQTVTINVTGVTDPKAVAAQVKAALKKATAEGIRNVASAPQ